jgi:hypothetical protein
MWRRHGGSGWRGEGAAAPERKFASYSHKICVIKIKQILCGWICNKIFFCRDCKFINIRDILYMSINNQSDIWEISCSIMIY